MLKIRLAASPLNCHPDHIVVGPSKTSSIFPQILNRRILKSGQNQPESVSKIGIRQYGEKGPLAGVGKFLDVLVLVRLLLLDPFIEVLETEAVTGVVVPPFHGLGLDRFDACIVCLGVLVQPQVESLRIVPGGGGQQPAMPFAGVIAIVTV